MSFDPYLHFQGNCREALQSYAAIFGGSVQMMTYAEAPDAVAGAPGGERIMHATLVVGARSLMASDFPPGMEGEPQQSVSISHEAADDATAQRVFDALAEGGAVIMPLGPTFWSGAFGMLKDRFGTHWMISGPWQPG